MPAPGPVLAPSRPRPRSRAPPPALTSPSHPASIYARHRVQKVAMGYALVHIALVYIFQLSPISSAVAPSVAEPLGLFAYYSGGDNWVAPPWQTYILFPGMVSFVITVRARTTWSMHVCYSPDAHWDRQALTRNDSCGSINGPTTTTTSSRCPARATVASAGAFFSGPSFALPRTSLHEAACWVCRLAKMRHALVAIQVPRAAFGTQVVQLIYLVRLSGERTPLVEVAARRALSLSSLAH